MDTQESSAAVSVVGAGEPSEAESADSTSRSRVRSVERALRVFEVLGEGGPEGVGLADLGRSVQTSKSTMLTLLRTLIDHGFVAEVGTGRGRRYQLGLSLARLGDRALRQFSLHDEGMATLRALTDETGWTSRLGVLDDGYAVVIGRIDAPGVIQFQSNLAKHELPHCSALGKAMLSQLPEPAVREIVGRTKLPARTGLRPSARNCIPIRLTRRGLSRQNEHEPLTIPADVSRGPEITLGIARHVKQLSRRSRLHAG